MQIQHPERILREMIEEAQAAKQAEASRDSLITGLFAQPDWPQPPRAQFPKLNKADRRSDFVLAALGLTLGLICALFPWYVFYSDIKITTHGLHVGGTGNRSGRVVADQAGNAAAPIAAQDIPSIPLDLFATGTVPDSAEDTDKAPGVDKQPFPAEAAKFRLVHVANGRAMIEDDAGLWVVQRGSTLPDKSRVSAIEQRGGKWVLVTSTDQVIELSK